MRYCPHCGRDISAHLAAEAPAIGMTVPTPYNMTQVWKGLMARAREIAASPPQPVELAERAAQQVLALCNSTKADGAAISTVVHLVFDRAVVPAGGVLYQAALLEGRMELDLERLRSMGYSVVDGKVQVVEDVPVGPAYSLIDYWGGARQHHRWHLAKPVQIEPSRNGDPFFMDDDMVAFGAVWKDAQRAGEAMHTLLELFTEGVSKSGLTAQPLVIEVLGH